MRLDLRNLFTRTSGDFFGRTYPIMQNAAYIRSGLDWLSRAQDMARDGGVAAQYSLFHGWDGSYIETTGYILETFFQAATLYRSGEYRKRAVRMADFLVRAQLPIGAFQSGTPQDLPPVPTVFNTGEDVRGLVTAYEETHKERYLTAAQKAADWLISVQEADGSWRRFEFQARPHAYHARTSWSLLRVWQTTKKAKYRQAALQNLEWVLDNQQENGWFLQCDFTRPVWPFTHAIDYTISGLLHSSEILAHNPRCQKAGKRCADALLAYYIQHRFMPATFNQKWHSNDTYTCLTGNAQIVLTWLALYKQTKKSQYLSYAQLLLNDIKKTVDLSSQDRNIRGAVAGAFPTFGGYSRWNYPNWATKFFVDACILMEDCLKS
jgi:hypothetical protein